MAPKDSQLGKRVKLTSVRRPFVYGTTARPFSPANPKPPGTPEGHTHSWEVFVRGIDPDIDVTYWLRRVQFKLHESIANHVRSASIHHHPPSTIHLSTIHLSNYPPAIDATPGHPFVVRETGWGEFEITIRLFYPPESGEKPQTLYHYLKLHPYGNSDDERANMADEVRAWQYDEQLFNEPYEAFFRTLTSGAHPRGGNPDSVTVAVGKKTGRGSTNNNNNSNSAPSLTHALLPPIEVDPAQGLMTSAAGVDVWQRTAMLPVTMRPSQPYARDTELAELRRMLAARQIVQDLQGRELARLRDTVAALARLREENAAAAVAAAADGTAATRSVGLRAGKLDGGA